ncbi:hypothetical protein ES703_123346 [subsurface metagenome]
MGRVSDRQSDISGGVHHGRAGGVAHAAATQRITIQVYHGRRDAVPHGSTIITIVSAGCCTTNNHQIRCIENFHIGSTRGDNARHVVAVGLQQVGISNIRGLGEADSGSISMGFVIGAVVGDPGDIGEDWLDYTHVVKRICPYLAGCV